MKKIILILFFFTSLLFSQGKIYFVLGSDTAIWEGMGTSNLNDYYNIQLYTEVPSNTSVFMDPAFRAKLVDSYGNPMKFTWWMMGGNIFRYATNINVPINNLMTLHLMRKHWGDKIELLGDELTMHYHTFNFFDSDGDGIKMWNQAKGFLDCKDDFEFTLAQYLIEENVFPVSFRSGWHFMDNEWQRYLNKILPYSLHNDSPSKQIDTIDPIANHIDWSKATQNFIPFNPDTNNYQLAGTNGKGWNVRSRHFRSANSTLINNIFLKAQSGVDQVVCLWGHLPEDDFIPNIIKIDSLIHVTAQKYPATKFQYTTAVEAMQLYRGNSDFSLPGNDIQEIVSGENVSYRISVDEPIFQQVPFAAFKNKNDDYGILSMNKTGPNQYESLPINKNNLAAVSIAFTDTLGNQVKKHFKYVEDDVYIDNNDLEKVQYSGSWTSNNQDLNFWNKSYTIPNSDSSKISIDYNHPTGGKFNLFYLPYSTCITDSSNLIIVNNTDSIYFNKDIYKRSLNYVGQLYLKSGINSIEIITKKNLNFDAIKLSPLIPDKHLYLSTKSIDFGTIEVDAPSIRYVNIENRGNSDLTISSVLNSSSLVKLNFNLPIVIPAGNEYNIALEINLTELAPFKDTLIINSDDTFNPQTKVAISGEGTYFTGILDNDDVLKYKEFGSWKTSSVTAYGESSRYTMEFNTASVLYNTRLTKKAVYEISYIVPVTVNAVKGKYTIINNGENISSTTIDQNIGSGAWVPLDTLALEPGSLNILLSYGGPTLPNSVLRADAIKVTALTLLGIDDEENTPSEFTVYQNYPNPFNPITNFKYFIPNDGNVELKIFNILGKEVMNVVNEYQNKGFHSIQINASNMASGVYFYSVKSNNFNITKKMVLLK